MVPEAIILHHYTKDHLIIEKIAWHWVDVAKCIFKHDLAPYPTDQGRIISILGFVQTTVPDADNMYRLGEMIASLSKMNPPALVIMSFLSQEAITRNYYVEPLEWAR